MSPKRTQLSRSVFLSAVIFDAASAAVLLSRSSPNMKLQNVKSKVMMTLPPILPITVSISRIAAR
jgi:hypothetical protein